MDQDPTIEQIDHLIESALQEDIGTGDITTQGTVDESLIMNLRSWLGKVWLCVG